MHRGDLLIASFSYKTSAISATPKQQKSSGGAKCSSSGTTEQADMALYATLVGDFVGTCLERWNTFDSNKFWEYVANHKLYSLCVPGLPTGFTAPIDARCRAQTCYIGAVAPDLGNPLHRQLFMEMMFKDAFIQGGNVTVRADFDGNYAGSFGGANAFSKSGMITMPYEEFEAACPPLGLPASFSARGLITQMRMQGRIAPDVHQKIASAVMDSSIVKHASQAFEWDLSKLPDSPDEVEVQARKLTHYLLDPEHEDGKSKAAFFAQVLGITHGHWSFLLTQLIDGLAHVSYESASRSARHTIQRRATGERMQRRDGHNTHSLDCPGGRASVACHGVPEP